MSIRVFVLDDHEVVRRGLSEALEPVDGIEIVGEAATLDEARRRIPAIHPDVAILDVLLPDGSGVDICRDIRRESPEVRCLMFTSYRDDEVLIDAIMAGAAGYLLKHAPVDEVVDSIRRVATGQSPLDTSVTAIVFDRLRNPLGQADRTSALTEQEHRILDLVARGLTNRQIGEQLHLAEKTVGNYVSVLLTKLGMKRRTEAAAYVARVAERDRQAR